MSIFNNSDFNCDISFETICDIVSKDYIITFEYINILLLILLIIYILINKYKLKKKFSKIKTISFIFTSILLLILSFSFTFVELYFSNLFKKDCYIKKRNICDYDYIIDDRIIAHKPVIYLYPEEKQEVKVELEVEWKLIADYPRYDEEIRGWEVTAYPDSRIIEEKKEYSYLFWEAEFENNDWDLSKWFIVEWKDAREFLQEKLSYIWLTPKEYNEFIVYWYPKMMNNKYNLVYFAWLDYTSKAPLNITPEPDSVLRVFTVIKPLEEKIEIQEQELERFDRKWFSVVEWGGTILE